MRKIVLGLVATAAIAAPLALAGSANAATTAPNASTVFLSKSTLQSTLHLNNAGFDKLTVKDFTATGTRQDHRHVYFTDNGTPVSEYEYSVNYVDTIKATPVWNGGHNQITGYNVTETGTVGDKANPVTWPTDEINTAYQTAFDKNGATEYHDNIFVVWTDFDVKVNGTDLGITFQHVS